MHKVITWAARSISPALFKRLRAIETRLTRIEANNPTLIERAARFVACEMVEGDYLEFGVYKGAAFSRAYHAFENAFMSRIEQNEGEASSDQQRRRLALWNSMRFVAFDSFQGLPNLTGLDTQTLDFAAGQYSASQAAFEARLAREQLDMSKVIIVPGWFSETCNQAVWDRLQLRKAAVVWIDSDLYESARTVLCGITDLIQDGTILIFDDWYAFRGNPDLGEQRAFREWINKLDGFQAVPYVQEGTWRNSFILTKTK